MTDSNRPVTLSADALAKLSKVSTATLTTELLKHGFANTFLRGLTPLRPDPHMAGYAVTLRWVPAREDVVENRYDNASNLQRIAVETVGPDDVLVMDARGETGAATLGEILATRMQVRGCAGLVTDGGLRDTQGIRELGLPAYVKAVNATNAFLLHHAADMNVPIGCAGVLVMPGDLIVGDGEGVVAVPAQVAEEVAHAAFETEVLEQFLQEKVAGGAPITGVYPPDDDTLAEFRQWRDARGL